MGGDETRFDSPEDKEALVRLEKRRTLLEENKVAWRLKSQVIWLNCGDENKKFFQGYARGKKMNNTIWELKNAEGEVV